MPILFASIKCHSVFAAIKCTVHDNKKRVYAVKFMCEEQEAIAKIYALDNRAIF